MALKIAVLASGKGSNLRRIAEACRSQEIPARIVLVFSDVESSGALRIAAEFGLTSKHISPQAYSSREEFDEAVAGAIEDSGAELLVFAGYMRLVSSSFISRFKGRMINVHPSLLPAFKGAHAVRDALDYGVKVIGVTVHFVTEDMDAGPIILQESLPVREGETMDELMTRVHEVEHRLYPEAIKLYSEGRLLIEGRRVRIKQDL